MVKSMVRSNNFESFLTSGIEDLCWTDPEVDPGSNPKLERRLLAVGFARGRRVGEFGDCLVVAAPVREGGGAGLGHLDKVEDQGAYSQYFIFFLTYKPAQ
jgi:hypothetical protein